MRDRLIDEILKLPGTRLNGCRDNRLPGNINVSFEGVESESLIMMLNQNGVAASSGSACTSGTLEPSHVLLSIGVPREIAGGSLRLSINGYTCGAYPQGAAASGRAASEAITERKMRQCSVVWRYK